ncbi:MAG: hypothetical protein JW755_05795 [Candidatus Aminicenantes bacterium]|nr:hypothetical protein [Candidatus Aminicenantes bacterium]
MKTIIRLIPILMISVLSTLSGWTRNAIPSYHIIAVEFSSPPKIDGHLDDEFWHDAFVVDTFTQYEPTEGAEPTEKTIAFIGYDKKNLYIGIRCKDSNPKAIRACLNQRDKVEGDDEVSIYLDTFNDKKRAFVFLVNPCGVQSDGIYNETQRRHRGGGFSRIDKNWDTFFLSGAHIDNHGYSIEIAIPFKSLRFPDSISQVWGLQIQRNIRRKNEEIYWYPRSRNINGFLRQAGQLVIEGELDKGKNFEIMPVMTGLMESGHKINPEPSMNFKYGITSNMTTDLTVNPDFSQIEADMPQIDVNQRYALYFPEKRPFFLEGKDLFDTPLELVYTRTINNPLWGAKLTGKIGKTTIGLLSAYDEDSPLIDIPLGDEEEEETEDDEDEEIETTRSIVNIFRLKQDLYSESHIGIIITDKETGDSWNSITQNFNRAAGLDGHFKINQTNSLSFQIVASKSQVGEVKTGVVPAVQFDFNHQSRHWSLTTNYTQLPEDFEASSGFFHRKDIRSFNTRLGYNILPQNELIIDIRPSIEYRRVYDFSNTLNDEEIRLGWFISGWRGSFLYGGYTTELERYENIDFKKQSLRLRLSSDPFAWFSGSINFNIGDGIYYEDNPYLGYKVSFGILATFKPLTNLTMLYDINNDTFYKEKGGDIEYKINLISQRINYQISRSLSLRLITDYNDYDKALYNSILLSYQYRPGTVFYLGMDDNQARDDSGIFRNEGRFYFVKFSYWWRI